MDASRETLFTDGVELGLAWNLVSTLNERGIVFARNAPASPAEAKASLARRACNAHEVFLQYHRRCPKRLVIVAAVRLRRVARREASVLTRVRFLWRASLRERLASRLIPRNLRLRRETSVFL